MAYDDRMAEVFEMLDKDPAYDAPTKLEIKKTLATYFTQRAKKMGDVVAVLSPGSRGPCHETWLDKSKVCMHLASEVFKNAEAGKFFLAKVSNEERLFFHHMHFSQVPVKRDKMVKQTEKLRTAMKEFDNKWNAIKGNDKDIDDKMKRTGEQYTELLVHAGQIAAQTEKRAREKMADTVKMIIKLGLMGVDLGVIEKMIDGAATAVGMKLNEAKDRKLEIAVLLSREEAIFATFKEAREVVEEFLEENGYPAIKDAWDDGEDAAEAFAAKVATPAQKSDGYDFARACKDQLQKVFTAAEREYKEFARAHEHKFFGPLGSAYMSELMEDDTWKNFSRSWADRREDFDDYLRERTLTASPDRILEVPLDGIEGDDRDRIYHQLRTACEQLLRSWNNLKDMTNDPDWFMDSRDKARSVLNAMR